MFLSIMFAIFIWPVIMIAAVVSFIKGIKNRKNAQQTYTKPSNSNPHKFHFESPEEENRRVNYWGYDDERWGKL